MERTKLTKGGPGATHLLSTAGWPQARLRTSGNFDFLIFKTGDASSVLFVVRSRDNVRRTRSSQWGVVHALWTGGHGPPTERRSQHTVALPPLQGTLPGPSSEQRSGQGTSVKCHSFGTHHGKGEPGALRVGSGAQVARGQGAKHPVT